MYEMQGNPVTGWADQVASVAFEGRQALPEILVSGRTRVMGVLNVTPNSFSDGGKWLDPAQAVAHGLEMLQNGADLIDVGGQSTAPGRPDVTPTEEQDRIMPVVEQLVAAGAVVSVDTLHAATARAVAGAGVAIINDVSGGRFDPEMYDTVSQLQQKHPGLCYLLQHWRAGAREMDAHNQYHDLVGQVLGEIDRASVTFQAAGGDPQRLIIDPGLGFAKHGPQDWEILRHLDRFVKTGLPVLVGASRKRFTAPLALPEGTFTGMHAEQSWHERDEVTNVLTTWCALRGVWAVRVHNPALAAVAVRAAAALVPDATTVEEAPWLLTGSATSEPAQGEPADGPSAGYSAGQGISENGQGRS